ncbi:hypothetical protein [Flavihumibacter profundi]|uniref:hypothetical protein n=1 Tax=Flavihumibacter profundi TaxID=2716883 RepID=UPI001CC75FF5|nr:hypothetical protein [Flavihumibacter profundi]MBZ5859603.1 hypothetical protein [Flavihumibacter profundi]
MDKYKISIDRYAPYMSFEGFKYLVAAKEILEDILFTSEHDKLFEGCNFIRSLLYLGEIPGLLKMKS